MNKKNFNFQSVITGKKVHRQQKFCSPTGRFEPASIPSRRENYKIQCLKLKLLYLYLQRKLKGC